MKALLGIEPKTIERTTIIEGQSFPIHEFTSSVWGEIVAPLRSSDITSEDAESIAEKTLNLMIVGLEGYGYEPTEEDRKTVTEIMSQGVIREYVHRLTMLNDYGFDTVKASEKKYEAALSNDTKPN